MFVPVVCGSTLVPIGPPPPLSWAPLGGLAPGGGGGGGKGHQKYSRLLLTSESVVSFLIVLTWVLFQYILTLVRVDIISRAATHCLTALILSLVQRTALIAAWLLEKMICVSSARCIVRCYAFCQCNCRHFGLKSGSIATQWSRSVTDLASKKVNPYTRLPEHPLEPSGQENPRDHGGLRIWFIRNTTSHLGHTQVAREAQPMNIIASVYNLKGVA